MRTDIRSSLKRRLPLVLSAVLCVTLIGVCVGAYIQLRRQLTSSAGDRVLAASRQVKDMLDGQVWRIRTEGRQLAATPEVAAVLARPTDASVRRLHLHYFGPGAAAGSRLRAISIFDRNGRLLGGADTAGSSLGAHALAFQLESPSAQQQPLMPGVTPLSEVNGIVEYRTIDPLVSVKGDTLGY